MGRGWVWAARLFALWIVANALVPMGIGAAAVYLHPDPTTVPAVTGVELRDVPPGTLVRLRGVVRTDTTLEDEWIDPGGTVLKADRRVAVARWGKICARRSRGSCRSYKPALLWHPGETAEVRPRAWRPESATVDGVPIALANLWIPYEAGDLPFDAPGHLVVTPKGGCFAEPGPELARCIELRRAAELAEGDVRIAYQGHAAGIESMVIGVWNGAEIGPHGGFLRMYPAMTEEEASRSAWTKRLFGYAMLALPSGFAVVPSIGLLLSFAPSVTPARRARGSAPPRRVT